MKSLWRPKSLKHQKSILGEHQTHLNVNKKLLVFTFFFSYIYSVIDVVVSLNSGNQNEVGYTAIMVAVVFQFMRLILFLLHISRGFGTNPKRVFLMELIFIIVYGAGVLSTWNIQMTIDPSRAYVVGLEAGWTFLYVHTLFNQWPWKAIIYVGVSIFGICKTLSDFGEFNMGPIQAAIQIILVLTSAFIEEHRRRQKLLHSLSLEKTGQTLRNILNSLPDNIAILNLQGDIRFYNEYFGISFQLTEDMSSAKLFSEIYQVKPRERHLNLKKLQDRYNFVRPMPRRTTRTYNGASRKPTRRSTLVKVNNDNNSPLMRYLTEEFEISKTAGDRILDPKEPKGPIQVGRSMRYSQLGPLKTLTEFFASIKHFKDLQEVLEFFCLNVDIIRTYTEKERSFFIFDAKYNTSEGVLKSFEIKISLSSFDSEDSFIIILRDTTHRDIIVTLEDKNDFKDSVLSSISHELRTPLNTNLNLLQLAIDAYTRSGKPPNNPTMITNQDNIDGTEISTAPAQDLKDIYLIPAHKSGKLLGYLINDIVDYSMLIARKFVANGKEKYLLKSLEKIRYLCEFQAREKNLEFHISISQDLNFKVGTDHRRLRQILINLVNNAIRFTNKGFVNLRIEPYNDNPDLIQFIVRDSGIGITQENLERMAALLDSGNFLNKLNKESSGVGMGLIISHLLAKELGPTALRMAGIKIESTLGEGSKFSFIIENWIRLADKTPSRQNDSVRLDSARTTGFLRKPSMAIARITGERTDLSIGNPKKEQQVDSAILGNEEEIDEEIAKMIKDDNFKLNVTENKLFKENSSPLFGSKNVSRIFLNVSDLPSSGILQRGRLESVSSPDYIVDPPNPLILPTHSNRTHKEDIPKMCTCPEILVVDDDMFNLFTMENLLGTIKYRIAKATNGEEAVEAIRKRKDLKCSDQCKMFKLIFMDLSMPIMDGFQATFKLKHMMKNREVEKIPIVACTAFVDQENTEKCFEYGMEGKISKPVNKNKLKECLRKYAMIVNDYED